MTKTLTNKASALAAAFATAISLTLAAPALACPDDKVCEPDPDCPAGFTCEIQRDKGPTEKIDDYKDLIDECVNNNCGYGAPDEGDDDDSGDDSGQEGGD